MFSAASAAAKSFVWPCGWSRRSRFSSSSTGNRKSDASATKLNASVRISTRSWNPSPSSDSATRVGRKINFSDLWWPSWCQCYKTFFVRNLRRGCIIKPITAVTYGFRNKLECLSLNTRLGWKGLPVTRWWGHRDRTRASTLCFCF